MGLINSVDRVSKSIDELIEQSNTKEEKNIKENELKNDIKKECISYLYEYIIEDNKSDYVYLNIDEFVAKISDNLKSIMIDKKKWVINKNTNDYELIKIKDYKYKIKNDYEFESIIREIFLKEYNKMVKHKSNLNKINKSKLRKLLLDKFNMYLRLDKDVITIYNQLYRQDIKEEIIEDISESEEERQLLSDIYYQTLNSLKVEYKKEFEDCKEYYKELKLQSKNKARKGNYKGFGGYILLGVSSVLKDLTRGIK